MSSQKLNPTFEKDHFEREIWGAGEVVCGIDEAGRGCTAGPVVAAAVILKDRCTDPQIRLDDSKLLSMAQRERAYAWIQKNSWVGVAIAHQRLIDKLNIYQATLLAMQRAVAQLSCYTTIRPSVILVDAMPLELKQSSYNEIPLYYFNFGESKSSSIASASIVAKVIRDTIMIRTHNALPMYGFLQHKGYGTLQHRAAVAHQGVSIIHRKTFTQFTAKNQQKENAQLDIFGKELHEAIR